MSRSDADILATTHVVMAIFWFFLGMGLGSFFGASTSGVPIDRLSGTVVWLTWAGGAAAHLAFHLSCPRVSWMRRLLFLEAG